MTGLLLHDDALGVDYLPVGDEPHHVEQFRTPTARVYLATIDPGQATMYHRHDRDTFYIILAGGRFRSDEPGKQPSRTRVGRSISRPRQLLWLIRRTLSGGWLMPTGTLLVQPHGAYPLIHRITADLRNQVPIRMLGIEPRTADPPVALATSESLTLECAHPRLKTYRIHLAAGERLQLGSLPAAILVVVIGIAETNQGSVDAGTAIPLGIDPIRIRAGAEDVDALLFVH